MHQQTDVHESITKQDRHNTNDPQNKYNSFLVHCRELAPDTIKLTGDRAQGGDSKHDSHYTALERSVKIFYWRA